MLKFIQISILLLLLVSCANPYVGLRVNTSNWCSYHNAENCIYRTEHLTIKIVEFKKLSDGDPESEYYMKGLIDFTSGSLGVFTTMLEKDFNIVFADNGVTVKTVGFFPMLNSMQAGVPFNVTFKSPKFDSFTFYYSMRMTG